MITNIGLTLLAALVAWGITKIISRRRKNKLLAVARPNLVKWAENEIVAIALKEDYDHARENSEGSEASLLVNNAAYFSDNPEYIARLGRYWTGSIAACNDLTQNCNVENQKFYFPLDENDEDVLNAPMSFETLAEAWSYFLSKDMSVEVVDF